MGKISLQNLDDYEDESPVMKFTKSHKVKSEKKKHEKIDHRKGYVDYGDIK